MRNVFTSKIASSLLVNMVCRVASANDAGKGHLPMRGSAEGDGMIAAACSAVQRATSGSPSSCSAGGLRWRRLVGFMLVGNSKHHVEYNEGIENFLPKSKEPSAKYDRKKYQLFSGSTC